MTMFFRNNYKSGTPALYRHLISDSGRIPTIITYRRNAPAAGDHAVKQTGFSVPSDYRQANRLTAPTFTLLLFNSFDISYYRSIV